MKKQIICLKLFLFTTVSIFAQEWHTDYEAVKRIASQDKKQIILVFQGSDWCAPCIKLDREIWSTEEFKSYAASHFVMLRADFPRKKKNALSLKQQQANAKLAELYNRKGIFPFVVVLDYNGKVLGQTSYKKISPTEYIKLLTSFKA